VIFRQFVGYQVKDMPPRSKHAPEKLSEDVVSLDKLRKMLWMDSIPTDLLYREEELDKIEEFCRFFVEKRDESYSLYLGGVPGTGKTSCVIQVSKFSARNAIFCLDHQQAEDGQKVEVQVYSFEWR
jgi:hypothetical protein